MQAEETEREDKKHGRRTSERIVFEAVTDWHEFFP